MTLAEPTFDGDGYPTEDTLEQIRTWPVNELADWERIIEFVHRAWTYQASFRRGTRRFREFRGGSLKRSYVVSTVGWSGNESLIAALEGNDLWWSLCAESWHRGGHYVFRVPA